MFEDGQDVAVEQAELKPERESARPPRFLSPFNSGDDLFGCGSCVLNGAAKIFEKDHFFYVVVITSDVHR